MTRPAAEGNPGLTAMEHSCRLVRPVFIYLKEQHGDHAFEQIAEKAGLSTEYLLDEHHWMSHDFYKVFLEELVAYTGDPRAPFKAGLHAATPEGYGHLYWLLQAFGSPRMIYQQIVRLVPKFTKVARYEILEMTGNRAVLKLTHNPGYVQSHLACLDALGELASVPTVQGSPPARAIERQCQADGADSCIYELTWINQPNALPRLLGILFAAVLVVVALVLLPGAIHHALPGVPSLVVASFVLLTGYLAGWVGELQRTNRWNARLAQELDHSLIESMEAVEDKFEALRAARAEILLKNEALEASNRQLAVAFETLKALDARKSEFLRIVGHDLKTPLASLRTYATLVTYEDTPPQDRREFLDIIEKESARLAGLVDRFMDLNKIESCGLQLASEAVDLVTLLRHISRVFKKDADVRGVAFDASVPDDLPTLEGDPGRLGQVISNVLSNACKFTPAGGTVKLVASVEPQGSGAATVVITISDTGPGIAEGLGESIYDRFTTGADDGDRQLTGQGLGLYITREIVGAHGGTICHESRRGEGTTFTIRLPETSALSDAEVSAYGQHGWR